MSPYLIDLLGTFLIGAGVGFAVGGIWGTYSGYTRGTDDTASRWARADAQKEDLARRAEAFRRQEEADRWSRRNVSPSLRSPNKSTISSGN